MRDNGQLRCLDVLKATFYPSQFPENPLSPRRLVSQFSVPDPKDVKAQLNRLGYVEEEKPLIQTISIRAATADKLACLAVDCFGNIAYQSLHLKFRSFLFAYGHQCY